MATNPFTPDLDTPQILNKVYNPTDDTLRVDATVTAVIGVVTIDASSSSVAIEGRVSGNLAEVTPAGSLKVDLEQVGGAAITLGQKVSAASIPVVISSDQSPITVTGSITTSPNVNVHDGSGVSISSTGSSLNVDVTNTVPVSQSTSPWVVSGSGNFTVVQPSGANLHVNVDNFPATVAVTQSTSPWVVSGTVTANIGTTNGLALDSTLSAPQGSISGGTAGTKSELAGGIFNSSPLTLTNGQQAALQLDSSGNLKTTATVTIPGTVSVTQGTSPWVDNITQFGSNPVVTGTGASGLGIPRVTVSNDSNILATQSGTWNINNISGTISLPTGASTSANQTNGTQKTQIVDGAGAVVGPEQTIAGTNYLPVVLASSATPGSALVARSIQVAGSDGTNAQTLKTDTSGHLLTALVAPPVGTITQAGKTIGTTAVRATVSGSAPSATRTVLAITADFASTAKFYIGSSTVTSSGANAGIQFTATQPVVFSNDAADYWIISDTVGQTVYFMEQA